jgi:von Willebrand factor type A domain/Aerotolerance regulator N-terminal
MNWSSALNGAQWAILLAIPPFVFLLYFLKLRRVPLEVPSTFLWRRAIEDMHVNSLWQKLRRNLLLLLQLLFLAALIGACLRPSLFGDQETGRRWILMLDHSASMQATDVAPNRLEAAKLKAKEQLSKMNRGDVAMVMAFSDRADVRQGFTADRNRLLTAIDTIQPTQRTTDIREAMRAASGLANPGRSSFDGKNDIQVAEALPATVFTYSDGDFPSFTEFDRGNLSIEYVPIGAPSIDNVAVEAFSVDRNDEQSEQVEAYARIMNYGSEKASLTASLYRSQTLVDAVSASIEPGKEKGLQFQMNLVSDEAETFRIEIDRKDQLSIDDLAHAVLRPARHVRLLVFTPGNTTLEKALSTNALKRVAKVEFLSPSSLPKDSKDNSIPWEEYDLAIFDQCQPIAMPNGNTFFIGAKPPADDWKMGEKSGPVILVDVDRTHPITEYLEIGNIRIVEGSVLTMPEGGQTLIRGDAGPVLCLASRGPYQDLALGFELVQSKDKETIINTDWGIKRSFPIFILGCVEYLGSSVSPSATANVRPGQPLAIRLPSQVVSANLKSPVGRNIEMERTESGQFIFTATDRTGVYTLTDSKDAVLDIFAVNLFSASESRLAVKPDIGIGEEKVAAATNLQRGRKEYWRWLLMLGLAFLMGEWVVYNRRLLV